MRWARWDRMTDGPVRGGKDEIKRWKDEVGWLIVQKLKRGGALGELEPCGGEEMGSMSTWHT